MTHGDTPGTPRFALTDVRRDEEGEARVQLSFSRSQYPADPQHSFLPLRLPENCRVVVSGSSLRGVHQAMLRLTLDLERGVYDFPLGSGTACQVELQPEARAFLRCEVAPADQPSGPLLNAVDLHFRPPLILHNLLQTLSQVHEIAEDRLLGRLKPLGMLAPPWLSHLSGLARESLDTAAVILLEHARGRAVASADGPRLQLSFSGYVRWFDQWEVPFQQVTLPATVLPVPFAALERLFSDRPLASAELVRPLREPWSVLRALIDATKSIEGELHLEAELPPLELQANSIDGVEWDIAARLPGRVNIRCPVQATRQGHRVELSVDELELSSGGSPEKLQLSASATADFDLQPGPRPLRDRLGLQLMARLRDGSRWPEIQLELQKRHALCRSRTRLPLQLHGLWTDGELALGYVPGGYLELRPAGPWRVAARLGSQGPCAFGRPRAQSSAELHGKLEGSLRPQPNGRWLVRLRIPGRLRAQLSQRLAALPELNVYDGVLEGKLDCGLDLDLRSELHWGGSEGLRLELAGTRFSFAVKRLEATLDGRRFSVPQRSRLAGHFVYGELSGSHCGPLALDLGWDLHGQPCLLSHGDREVSLLSADLRRGNLVLRLDRAGKLSFTGHEESFYGPRYFNALLNPGSDPGYLQELLRSDDAVAHAVAALDTFNPGLAELLTDLQALWRGVQVILRREGVRRAGQFIPRLAMTRVLSKLLTGTDEIQARLIPIVKQVTEGKGLDLAATRELLLQQLSEFDIDYEVSFLLNWLDLVLSPTEPLEPPRAEEELPLDLDPRYAQAWQGVPAAAEIYEAVQQGRIDKTWAQRLADLAPRLTRAQLGHILERASGDWNRSALARLRYVYELKQRVAEIAAGYGGIEYACQPWVIASFLGEAVGPLPGINIAEVEARAWPPPCALGPEEVAVLLQAGLASGWQSAQTQLNNRLLIELLRRQPPAFTREVFIELGHQSPRALSGILFAFLGQDQDKLAEPVDLVALLEEKLGTAVPRQTDYMAGGSKARRSYYEALSRLADEIIEEANPYLASKLHLQGLRHPALPELVLRPSLERLEERAREQIARADAYGAKCTFAGKASGPQEAARSAYLTACQACAHLLRREPRAFQLPWFKDFWLRNEEALKVLSVVRGHQEDLDQDRRWLAVQSGRTEFEHEQDLLETIVRVLYWDASHQRALLRDPLVRLLIPPPAGRYDFTVVSCMGVITDGMRGAELEQAYLRLEERRGIRVIRAHTGTARSLEHNAREIITAIETCTSPWGIIGYSQGCANALLAESLLCGGTPDEQHLLHRFICRNLLFSSANGSAHGTGGMLKFMRAMVLGERYLKHYQAVMSREAVDVALRAFGAMLDSRLFVAVLGGAHSLTFERARMLHRDGQFLDRVPTSTTRGVTTREQLPEALEFLFSMLGAQTGGAEQDTQVLVADAIGFSNRVRNDYTRALERCDMGSLPQATHHWAPLTREVEFITTLRDIERAVYMTPKDRLVWPWIEVNARFGRIQFL